MNVLALFAKIKLFVFDIDGVLTDGQILLLDNGEMARSMNIKDGYALQLAVKKGYPILIISGGTSTAVQHRLLKLGITNLYFGVKDKQQVLTDFLQQNTFTFHEILYMGDDIPDILPMKMVALPCAPADAVQEVLQIATYISPLHGGKGCVRDVIEKVLKLQNNWNEND